MNDKTLNLQVYIQSNQINLDKKSMDIIMSTKILRPTKFPNHKNLNPPNNYTYINHKCGQYTLVV